MVIKILGCGTIQPEYPPENCSGYLVDNKILIDCGPGIWKAIAEAQISVTSINHILLSHFHTDHTSDIGAILMTRWMLKDKINRHVEVYGPAGLERWFMQLSALLGNWINDLDVKVYELKESKVNICDYRIDSRFTGHTENSLCYKITDGQDKKLFYSGDTDYNISVISLATGCDVAIIESSNTDETKVEGHLTPRLAGKIAREAKVKSLILTHRYPEVCKVDAKAEAAKYFSGNITLSKDGLEIDL